jgi:rubrerythrin
VIATTTSQPTDVTASLDLAKLSLQDALDLAILIEEEARERYEEFTRLTGGRYPGDAGDMFRLMASYERRHGEELSAHRKKLFGDAPRRVRREQLEDVEAPDRGKPRVFMSAREALEVALASEEKAHEFFAATARNASDGDVRALFEELGREELQHAAMVREKLERLPPGPDIEPEEADEPGMDPGN